MKKLILSGANTPSTKDSLKMSKSYIPPNCTVLIVEDDASNFIQLARMLDSMGIFSEWKLSGYELTEFATSLPHLNLILLDILLPNDDRNSVLKTLRSSEQLKGIPLIAMAFEESNFLEEKLSISNFDGFLTNPLDPECFQEQIFEYLCS
jgi:CheY-like chemotaxis protein